MAFVISFYTNSASFSNAILFASPFIYDAVGPLFWGFSALICGMGFLVLLTTNSKVRNAFLNIWTVLMFLYAGATIAYGVHVVLGFYNLYAVLPDLFGAIGAGVTGVAESIASSFGGKVPEKLRDKLSPGSSLVTLAESFSVAAILRFLPYPFDFVVFMGHRLDVAAVLYVVFPGSFALLSAPVVLSIRNYFASEEKGVIKHRARYEGVPLMSFMCGGGDVDFDGNESGGEEEDLASTFDGSSSYSDENESLLPESSESSRRSSYSRS